MSPTLTAEYEVRVLEREKGAAMDIWAYQGKVMADRGEVAQRGVARYTNGVLTKYYKCDQIMAEG